MPKRKSGPNSELMIRAAAEGEQFAQRGQEAVLRAKEQSAQEISDVGKQLVGIGERQHDREFQASEAEKERAFRSGEGLKERVARSGDQARELRSREKIEADRLSLEAANKGLEEVPQEQGGAPPGGALDPRAQKVKDDMERGKEQQTKPIEMSQDGPKKYRHTEDRQAKEKSELEIKRANAETAAANAFNARQRLVNDYNNAQYKKDQDAMKQLRASFEAPIKADGKLIDDIGNGTLGPQDPRWAQLEAMAEDNPSGEIKQEIVDRKNGPNLQRMLRNRQMMNYIKMAAETGDTPDDALVDVSNPLYVKFKVATQQAAQFLGMSAIGSFVDVQSTQHKNRLCQQAGALTMMLEPIYGAMAPAAQLGASMMPGPARIAAQAGLQQQAGQGLQQLGRSANEQPAGPQQPAAATPAGPGIQIPRNVPGRQQHGSPGRGPK